MRTLLIDNHDSYTYNVFHLLAGVSGEDPVVIDNDAVSWKALSRWDFDAVVLSPGPGRPKRWHDFGVCRDVLRHGTTPLFGICLGHQGLGDWLDGTVTNAPLAMHGRLSPIEHVADGLFADIPQRFQAVRYHSLAVRTGSLGPNGRVIAWTDDGVVMGIEHLHRPMCGVQFHPESIATEYGRKLFENFYAMAERHASPRPGTRAPVAPTPPRPAPRTPEPAEPSEPPQATLRLHTRTIEGEPSTEAVFERLLADASHAFWLDSADAPTTLARRSYLGTSAGAERCILTYDVNTGRVEIDGPDGQRVERLSIFDLLDRELGQHTVAFPEGHENGPIGGFVGYLGYECKADAGSPNVHRSSLPDAHFMRANRLITVDHEGHRTQLMALSGDDGADAERWLDEAERVVREALLDPAAAPASTVPVADDGVSLTGEPLTFRCERAREDYLADVARCQAALVAGESYEICLTNRITAPVTPEPFELYRVLRRRNPSPFAAYLKLGETAIVSSSPERFISVSTDGAVQARPIKGTITRSDDPVEDAALRDELGRDEKSQAEHLMIVDLLRNDLGRVCQVGSVTVPELMVLEPYATVHQMTSTITGTLDEGRSPVECVRACFPGGSMTGAPKIRSMEIIDDIELSARGVYSGGLGYFGLDGSVDLSIVIRTIVLEATGLTIGAGGAIVLQSDPAGEFDELMLKARAPMTAVAEVVTGDGDPSTLDVQLEHPREVRELA